TQRARRRALRRFFMAPDHTAVSPQIATPSLLLRGVRDAWRMKQIELLRHAPRDPDRDALSPEGRMLAADLGRSRPGIRDDAVVVSPAERAAETVAWILRGANQQLPPTHGVVPGLAGEDASGGSPEGLAAGLRSLLVELNEGERALAVSHTPFVE